MKMLLRYFCILCATVSAAGLAGCARYSPEPITQTAVETALAPPTADVLSVEARSIKHPILTPVELTPDQGLSPDQAAILAVLVNPSLRAKRDERGIAQAELLQAGILPNPSLSLSLEPTLSGPDRGTGYGIGVSWDIASLISRNARLDAASLHAASVDLDVAWEEWQTAQAARGAVYARMALEAQLATAREVEDRLNDNLSLVRQSVDKGHATEVELAAAEAAAQEAHATVLDLTQKLRKQKLALNALLGLPADTEVKLREGIALPSRLELPTKDKLLDGLEERRLDLIALKRGYDSQDATVRATVLSRFPKIDLGLNLARDTSKNVTLGPSADMDLPIFDRNQGNIAIQTATRKQLFDEYVNRVFEARNDIAAALADIESLSEQIAADEAALPVLSRLVDTYDKALTSGHVDILSYYEAKNSLAKKAIELIALKQELVQARTELEIAAGEYLPETQAPTQSSGAPGTK
jgi:outer membrane protein, heavy metal efflux system